MPYIRLTIAKPSRGQEARLEELMRKLSELSEGQPGFIEGWLLRPKDNSGEIARVAVYEDEASAEAMANSQSWMALRSEIHLCTEPGHQDRAFFSI
jgi:quinol monooxygenase YgiN